MEDATQHEDCVVRESTTRALYLEDAPTQYEDVIVRQSRESTKSAYVIENTSRTGQQRALSLGSCNAA